MAALNETTSNNRLHNCVAPPSPTDFIDCSCYTLNFMERKFLNIGIDPTDAFAVKVRIITPSRYVNLTPDFLARIYSLMDKILSVVLDTPKYKCHLFLETALFKVSHCVLNQENHLVIELKTATGFRVLLNRYDLFRLENLKRCILETVARKTVSSRPAVLKQFDHVSDYINKTIAKMRTPPSDMNELRMFIKSVQDEKIVSSMPKKGVNYAAQIKMFATTQLAECWVNARSAGNLSVITPSSSRSAPPTHAAGRSDHSDGPRCTARAPAPDERADEDDESDSAVPETGRGAKRKFSS
ncbi:Hypothetical protein CINCED_3A005403 [Cinara cedri]|uniref:Uncharacterized protein n=1 Tax=Cinara cedri TaxID=506608 RepID=A0A5E4NJE6_9HEMI|nr:Hypothetical protein CINCED_3A005403 [Cinara cedri]